MGFTWECDGNTLEEKRMIEDSLPEGLTYKIAKYKLIERSDIKEEIKFWAAFSVSVSDKEEATIFIEKIATLNGTELRKRTKEMRRKDFASQRYNCSRKLRKRKKNHEKQVGKDTDCQAFFSFKLYDSKNDAGEYDLMVKINYEHNHEVLTTGAWNFLGISESTKARYSQLFAEGYTPSKARLIYVAELKEKLGEALFFKESAKRSINPGSGTVFDMWTKYVGRFGSANGPDSFVKACKEIEKVNSKAGEKIASIRQLANGVVVVAVCDQLMRRTHQLVQQSGDVVFVDATGSLDRCNHQVSFFAL